MSVVAEYPLVTAVAPGTPVTYPVTFTFEQAEDLVVTVQTGAADPIVKSLGIHYSVVGDGLAGSAVVDFLAAHEPATDDVVTIKRATSQAQPDSFGDNGVFLPQMAARGFDRITRMVQELQRDLGLGGGGGGGGGGATAWSEIVGVPTNVGQLAGLAGAADKLAYFSGAFAMSLTDLTVFGRQVIGAASAAAVLALITPLSAKGDVVGHDGAATTRLAVGTDGHVLTADATAPLGIKWAAPSGGGGGSPAWSDVTSKPQNVVDLAGLTNDADKIPYFTGAGMATFTASSFSRGLMANADAPTWRSALGVTSGGASGPFRAMVDYGAIENNTADDKLSWDAFAADTGNKRAWLENTSYHSGTPQQIGRPAKGPGAIRFNASDYFPADFCWMTSRPTVSALAAGPNHNFASDISRVEATYYVIGQNSANLRKGRGVTQLNDGYWETAFTPRWEMFTNLSGWSGITARLAGAISAGATAATLNNASHGITTGETIGFTDAAGEILETRTVTVSGATISWSGGLSNAYPADRAVTHGKRTMHQFRMGEVSHRMAGDCYHNVYVISATYAPLASQTHFFETSTVGVDGGTVAFGASGIYATGREMQYADGGFDVAVIDTVASFTRNVDTGARSVVWFGRFDKSEGSKPIDVFHAMAGKARIGLDFARADFSSNGNAAVQMALGHKIFLNSVVDVTPGARGYSPIYGALFAQTRGDMWVGSDNDGAGAAASDHVLIGFAGTSGGRDARIRIRPTAIQFNRAVTMAESLGVGTNISMGSAAILAWGAGSGNYIQWMSGLNAFGFFKGGSLFTTI